MGILEKIKSLEDEMKRTQKNKATEYHIGLMKGRLAKLRSQLLDIKEKSSKGGGGDGFEAKKSGHARVCLIGFPSVGKSTLLNKITNTKSEVASYEYTTLTCIPGTLEYKGSTIQILDLPGIIEGASKGIGRGKQVISIARTADLVLMMMDASRGKIHKNLLLKELENAGIRCNQPPPNISFHRKKKGNLRLTFGVRQTKGVSEKFVREILRQRKIHHCEIVLREDASIDDFIDVIEGNRIYVKCLFVYNKIDTITIEELNDMAREKDTLVCSLALKMNIEKLKARIWEYLDLIRVYTKKKGSAPDFKTPFVVRSGTTVEVICKLVHIDFVKKFKSAMVWGKSSKYPQGQTVGLSHVLADEDVLCLSTK